MLKKSAKSRHAEGFEVSDRTEGLLFLEETRVKNLSSKARTAVALCIPARNWAAAPCPHALPPRPPGAASLLPPRQFLPHRGFILPRARPKLERFGSTK